MVKVDVFYRYAVFQDHPLSYQAILIKKAGKTKRQRIAQRLPFSLGAGIKLQKNGNHENGHN